MALLPILIISQSEVSVVERLGKFNRIANTGPNFILPFVENIKSLEYTEQVINPQGQIVGRRKKRANRIDLREQVLNFPAQDVITKDNVTMRIDAILYYRIVDPVKVVYAIADFTEAIEKLTQTTLRGVVGELELDQTLSSRDYINSRIRTVVDEVTDQWGVDVTRVELQDIQPPQRIAQTMELQMTAERQRRAEILAAEGEKSAQVLRAEGKASARIQEAEAEAQAVVKAAEADARSRVLQADAEARAIAAIKNAIGEQDLVEYLVALRYLETLPELARSGEASKIFVPYEATGLLGGVGQHARAIQQQRHAFRSRSRSEASP
ncbi:MAG: paraslipin [Anaerolineae bacterium]|nr:paraslipin [Anaerolineae bacterium]